MTQLAKSNTEPAPCSRCGGVIPPGEGFIYRCSEVTCREHKGLINGGLHCSCRDDYKCKQLALRRKKRNREIEKAWNEKQKEKQLALEY